MIWSGNDKKFSVPSYVRIFIRHPLVKSGSDPSILAEKDACGVGQRLNFVGFFMGKKFLRRHSMTSQFCGFPKSGKRCSHSQAQLSQIWSRSKKLFRIYSISKNLHCAFYKQPVYKQTSPWMANYLAIKTIKTAG